MKRHIFSLIIIAAATTASAQVKKPLVSAITDKDLRNDMYQVAADQFNGREAGTLDELKVAVWLANKAKEAGIKPAGDNGTYFQFYDMYRHQVLTEYEHLMPYHKDQLPNSHHLFCSNLQH